MKLVEIRLVSMRDWVRGFLLLIEKFEDFGRIGDGGFELDWDFVIDLAGELGNFDDGLICDFLFAES